VWIARGLGNVEKTICLISFVPLAAGEQNERVSVGPADGADMDRDTALALLKDVLAETVRADGPDLNVQTSFPLFSCVLRWIRDRTPSPRPGRSAAAREAGCRAAHSMRLKDLASRPVFLTRAIDGSVSCSGHRARTSSTCRTGGTCDRVRALDESQRTAHRR